VVDTSYEALEAIARGRRQARPSGPPPGRVRHGSQAGGGETLEAILVTPQRPGASCPAPDPADFAGREVWLVHPWALDGPPPGLPAGTLVAGLWLDGHHRRWPWSATRWRFVGRRMDALTGAQWRGTAEQWARALAGAARVSGWQDPHLGPLGPALGLAPRPPAFAEPATACRSFSQFWRAVRFAD